MNNVMDNDRALVEAGRETQPKPLLRAKPVA